MTAQKRRGAIRSIGTVQRMSPDEHGREWLVQYWNMDGGDYPGMHVQGPITTVCGWSTAELALISHLAQRTSHAEAIEFAESLRELPAPVAEMQEEAPQEEATDLDATVAALQRGEPVIANVTLLGAVVINDQDHAITALGAKLHSCRFVSQADPALILRGTELITPFVETPNSRYGNLNAYYGLSR